MNEFLEEKCIYNRRNTTPRFIDRFHKDYPQRLQNIPSPPAGIYVKGELPKDQIPSVAIVGSRICSEYGRQVAKEFACVLAKNNIQIISGMARGIDGISQKEAVLVGGSTFGVLGCGINIVYPKENSQLYEEVIRKGGLISEFPPDAPPLAKQFPSRNRIISGLADIVLVIEAKQRSGTSITVSRALEQGKDVYAVPGRIYDSCSEGCNQLISQGAGIANSPYEMLKQMGILPYEKEEKEKKNLNMLEKKEKVVYSCLDLYPKNLEEIVNGVPFAVPEILEQLFHLQMKGFVKEIGKNNYIRIQ